MIAYDNAAPLQYLENMNPSRQYSLEIVSDGFLIATHVSDVAPTGESYLGGIVSPDGTQVYWVNDTRPLP